MAGADTEKLPEKAVWRRSRDFTLLWSGSGIAHAGGVSAAIAGPLLALSVTGSPAAAAWVAAAGTLPSLLLHLPAGVVVDRFDRRLLMLTCQVLRCVVAAALAGGLLVWQDRGWPLLIVAAAADGALAAVYNLAEVTVIGRMVPNGQLVAAMATNEARHHTGLLLGRPLGGFLFDLGRAVPFAANAVFALLAVVSIGSMKTAGFRSARSAEEPAASGFTECLVTLWRDFFLRRVLIVCAVTNFAFQTVFLILIVQADRQIDSSSLIGILFAASGLGGLLGSLVARRILPGKRPGVVVVVCVWGWVAMTAVVALADRPLTGLAAWAGVSFIGAHINVALTSYRAARMPDDLLARMASVNLFVTRGAVPLGALFAGYLLSVMPGTRSAALVVAATTLAVAVAYSVPRRWTRRFPRPRRAASAGQAEGDLRDAVPAGTKSSLRPAENLSPQR